MKTNLLIFFSMLAYTAEAQQISQNFDTVSSISGLVNFSLTGSGQFNGIGPEAVGTGAGAALVMAAGSGKLQFTRPGSVNSFFSRKYLGYNFPQIPVYGALIGKTNNPTVIKPAVARSLGIIHLREGLTLTLPGSYSEPVYTLGYKLFLNVNYAPSDTGAVEFPDSTTFKTGLANALAVNGMKPMMIAVENEEPNRNYHKGYAWQYINELMAGVNLAHSLGFKATNGGITAEVLRYLTYRDYVQRGVMDSATRFYNRTAAALGFDTHYNAVFLQTSGRFCDTLLNAYAAIPMDYVNFHWYGGDEGGSESDILHQCIGFLERKTGKKAITNEIGQYDTLASTVNDLLAETLAKQIPIVFWYDADGTNAIALNTPSGQLRPNGTAFRDFLAAHNLNYHIPDFVSVSFKVKATGSTTAVGTGNNLLIGNGFGVNATDEAPDSIHARITLAFTDDGKFSVGDGEGNVYASGTAYNTEQAVKWVINNSGVPKSYLAPGGTVEAIANNTWDLWIGTAKAYNDHVSFRNTPLLNDIKFLYNQGNATIQFDDFNISGAAEPAALPVQFVSFEASVQKAGILLQWSTASEQNNSHFDVLHSTDGVRFVKQGTVKGAGTTGEMQHYSFTDNTARDGINYYQLEQVDLDGKAVKSNILSLNKPRENASRLKVYPERSGTNIILEYASGMADRGKIIISDINGHEVQERTVYIAAGVNSWTLALPFPAGTYILTLQSVHETVSIKFAR